MRYGIVVHGPEVIDTGLAAKVLDTLEAEGEVEATLGGAMGLAALIDAALERRVRVVPRQLVSDALIDMDARSDVVVLLNHAKSRESGVAFGRMVVGRAMGSLTKPLVQLDNGFCIIWRPGPLGAVDGLVRTCSSERVVPPPLSNGERGRRVISGVRAGENLWINGTVVGRATGTRVVVISDGGHLSFEGLEVKPHGLEKLKAVDLEQAIIRSGSVRRTSASVRGAERPAGNRVVLVDHRAEDAIFRARGATAAITVGDDTTCVATSLLARLGVPVVGIVDGDEDGICIDRSAAPGSVILRLCPGNDDQLGARVREDIFRGREETQYKGGLEDLIARVVTLAGDKLLEVKKKG